MNDFENRLKELNMKGIEAPDNFEELMKSTLDNVKEEPKRKVINKDRLIKVAGVFLAIIIILNFQNVSAYFKTLLGYDEYFSFNSYIKELNDENKIQGINKEVTFSDGKKVIIEGLLYDGKFVKVFAKELKAITETVEIDVVDGKAREYYDKRDDNNSLYTVTTSLAGENLDSVIIQLSYKDEKIDCELIIDKDKMINSTIISDMNDNIVVIDEVEVKINSLRISSLAIEVDYSVTSKNKGKVNGIQTKSKSFFNEGITANVAIDSKYLNAKGGVIFNSIEELDHGVRFSQQIYCNDPRIDKVNNVEVVVNIDSSTYFSEPLTDKLNNTWINEDLFIEEVSVDNEDNNSVKVGFWTKSNKLWNDIETKYSIQPIDSFYVQEKNQTKELLGEDYKEYFYMSVSLMKKDFEGNNVKPSLVENMCYKINIKDRKLTFKIK